MSKTTVCMYVDMPIFRRQFVDTLCVPCIPVDIVSEKENVLRKLRRVLLVIVSLHE